MKPGVGKRFKTPVTLVIIRAVTAGCLIAGVVFLSVNLFAWYSGVKEAERLKNLSIPDRIETTVPMPAAPAEEAEALEPESEEPKQILPKYRKLLELNDEI